MISLVLIMAPLAAAAAPDMGRVHALLVGVSEYPHLGPEVQLVGPRHDVLLWRDFLHERGWDERMQVLADRVEGAALPTRAAILQALQELAESAEQGDFVFMLFAGHGAQQPASDATIADEPDGLDEIFLPRDASGWYAPLASVENAIIDIEFKAAIDAVRERGAFVWAVFDTCHSATMTRAVHLPGVRYRQVTPAQLGIPFDAIAEARARAAAHTEVRTRGPATEGRQRSPLGEVSTELSGGLVAFYAAQSTQETPEFPLPRGSADARDHGVFSFTLYQSIQAAPAASYRQLIDMIIQRFHTMPGATAVPMAEGTELDARVFGGDTTALAQWQVHNDGRRLRLAAGQLQNLTRGTIVALTSSPTAAEDEVLGYAEIVSAEFVSSTLRLVEFNGTETPRLLGLPPVSFARPVEVPVDFTLQVGLLESSTAAVCEEPSTTLRSAVASLQTAHAPIAQRLQWVEEASGPAAVWVCESDGSVYLIDGHTPLDDEGNGRPQAPAIALDADHPDAASVLGERLDDALNRMARVHNLLRIAQYSGSGPAPIETEFNVRRASDGLQVPCGPIGAFELPEGTEQHPSDIEVALTDGDCISLFVTNTAPTPVDVTVLFVDANAGISMLWPTERQLHNSRIEAGARIAIGEFEAYADTLGREQLMVLAVPVEGASQPLDLHFLTQSAIPAATRGHLARNSVTELLMEAGFGTERTRAVRQAGQEAQRLDAALFPIRVTEDE